MNKYLIYLKNPKIWGMILLIIVVIIAIVTIIISLKPTPLPNTKICAGSKIKTICPDKSIQCADTCPEDQHWNCSAPGSSGGYGACECKNNSLKICNKKSECCTTCVNDMCCDVKDQAIYIDNGKQVSKCCPPTTTPGNTGQGCLSLCGSSSNPCPQGQFCMQIAGLTGSDFTDAVTHSKKDQSYRSDDGSIIYACSIPSKCEFGISNLDIAPYHSTVGGLSSYYNTINIMKDGTDNICIPNDNTQYGSTGSVCYHTDNQSKESCTTTNCTWLSSFDILNQDQGMNNLKKHMGAIMYNDNKTGLGYYCGNIEDRWIQYKQSRLSSGTCNWQDCLSQVVEPGVTRLSWDGEKCLALKSPKNVGIRGSVQCTDVGVPCPSCSKAGDYSNCVKCKGFGDPCKNCTVAGTYVDDCDRGLWDFTDCKNDPNMVLNSFADLGKTCNQDGTTICGNCAWGGNNPSSSISPFGSLKSSIKNEENVYCVNDGQIYPTIPPTPAPLCDTTYILNKDRNTCVYPCTETGEDAREYTDNSHDANNKLFFTSVFNQDDQKISCFRNIIPFSYAKNMCNHVPQLNYCVGIDNEDSLKWLKDNKYEQQVTGTYMNGMCKAISDGHDCVIQLKDNIQFNPPPVEGLPQYYFPKNGRDWKIDEPNQQAPYDGWPLNLWFEGKPSDNFYYSTNVHDNFFHSHPQLQEDLGYDLNKFLYGNYSYKVP
jgi:hypothetical protein